MERTISLGIDFIIRKCKADKNRADIFARITVNGDRKEISIKEQIASADWNSARESVNGKTTEIKAINYAIENTRFRIKEKYRALEDSGVLITAEIIKNSYLGIQNNQKGHKLCELLEYYQKIWRFKMKAGGFKNYYTTIAYLKLYLGRNFSGSDIYLSQVNMQLATDFEHFIRNNAIKSHDPCIGNGVGKHIQRFKRIINWAVEIEWLTANPIEKFSCPLKKNKRKKLTIEQLVRLENKFFADRSLQTVKDLFLASCYTGFAFVDIIQLSQQHFELDANGTLWSKIYRIKTDSLSPVPILKSASIIFQKYQQHPGSLKRGTIFPYLTNQYVNRSLKIIKVACEIDIPLTFHIARHTFAKTVALKNGVPLETVQMMMGHTKISTTQIYADVDEEKIINDMAGLEEKLNIQRNVICNC